MINYIMETVPDDVLSNVNRHSPVECDCGKWLYIDEKTKEVKVWSKKIPAFKGINWFYDQNK